MLREFRACPAQYYAIVSGRQRQRSPDVFRIGRAVHKLVLEGESAYRAAFSVGGPINEKTGRSFAAGSRAFAVWVRECGLEWGRVLTAGEDADIASMQRALRSHREISRYLCAGWAEVSVRAGFAGLPCQARLDWLRPDGVAIDLKTTSDISCFEADARRLGYLYQFAFYRDVVRAAGGGELDMIAVVVEKKAPFRAGLWRFHAETLEPYAVQNRLALAALRRCREENRWPTGYEGTRSYPPGGQPPLWLN